MGAEAGAPSVATATTVTTTTAVTATTEATSGGEGAATSETNPEVSGSAAVRRAGTAAGTEAERGTRAGVAVTAAREDNWIGAQAPGPCFLSFF